MQNPLKHLRHFLSFITSTAIDFVAATAINFLNANISYSNFKVFDFNQNWKFDYYFEFINFKQLHYSILRLLNFCLINFFLNQVL